MNTTALLIGLGPLIGWGLFPTIASKTGGKPVNQIIGSTLGTCLFAAVYFVLEGVTFPTGLNLFFALLSGIGWAVAQIITFRSFELIGSSRAMPITTALQLLGASLWGVFALGDWPKPVDKLVGAFALILIIFGAWMTVWSEKKEASQSSALRKAVLLLAIGEIGYWGYSAAPQATSISGQEAFFPQAIGMLLVAIVYGCLTWRKEGTNPFAQKVSYWQIIAGLFFAFAALTYLISAKPDMNGLATGFILSQTSVVLATLTGIFVLGQHKTKKEMAITIAGLILIVAAAALTVLV